MDYVKVGKIISKKRKQKKITKKELAEILNVDKDCITHWEKGKCLPYINKMAQLSNILDISVNDMIGNNTEIIDNKSLKNCYLIMLSSIVVALSYNSFLFIPFSLIFLLLGISLLFKELKKLYN